PAKCLPRSALLLFAILAGACILTLGGHLYSPDEEILFRVTRSVARLEGFAIEPIAAGFGTRPRSEMDPETGEVVAAPREDGRQYAQYGVGQPILAAPLYWLGQGLKMIGEGDGWFELSRRVRTTEAIAMVDETVSLEEARARGREYAERLPMGLFNVIVTALTGVVLLLIIVEATGDLTAGFVTGLLWGLGSVMWFYSRTFFTEPLAGLCVLVAIYGMMRSFRPGLGKTAANSWLIIAGLALGYGCLVRLDTVIFCPALGLFAMFGHHDHVRPGDAHTWKAALLEDLRTPNPWLRLLLLAAPVMAAGGLIALMNTLWYGSPLSSGYSDQPEGIAFSTPVLAGLYGFTASIGKGMFFFSPVLVLMFVGVRPLLRRRAVFGVASLLAALMFLLVMSKWQNWAGGWCWGPRHILQLHALLILPVGFWLAEGFTAARRKVVLALLVVGVAVQVYGCSQSFFEYYHLYFRAPESPNALIVGDAENRSVVYAPQVGGLYDTRTQRHVQIVLHDAQSNQAIRPLSPVEFLRAPISDSIYQPQNSQWTRYTEMYRDPGVHDFFWLHLVDWLRES
ncbi:MAG: glycosyltransferase family 39 protein, partial [Candidatus Sumerlaeota bacterium]